MGKQKIIVIGGGLAGVEACWQASKRGIDVELLEMRPAVMTEAHTTGFLGELVCSNSLGATQLSTASGLLKEELKMLDSFFLRIAEKNRVPAGSSFSVDRLQLAKDISEEIQKIPNITIINREVKEIPVTDSPVIIATGPLTSDDFAKNLTKLTMRKNLFFYDATSPIINAETIDFDKVFMASRYDKGEADFVNIPLDEAQYTEFINDLLTAERVEIKDLEKNIFFDACLPIEEIACRGEKSLAFGPLKPVGLVNPNTNQMPYAVIQLRQDDLKKNFYQMVGFQTRLKWGEQKRIFRKLPGLEKAEFERYGRMHRNTYISAPLIINKFYQCKFSPNIFFAGQICGVEGYVESICSGLIAGIFASQRLLNKTLYNLPETTASGALINYVSQSDWRNFKPTRFSFGLLPEVETEAGKRRKLRKKEKKELKAKIALENLAKWIKKAEI
ncbi:MAG: methylenetetrahydrofolate--tRNA-(uracil(54)-C(5))-methyltransferase (FADH(2)-oxidizing) TrmFO [Candidatus Aminicenantes bacterium]|nr:MAG: methylenetetrahydrofolate--tRNA-(uracil(54)-C(5))-methyltransferase (FADH(2)-oxidizing) TrmFO [Candidatus Aminicenantes bacterium]